MSDEELPEGWARSTVNEVSESIRYGHTASAIHGQAGPRFLRITDIQNGKVQWDQVPTCEVEDHELPRYQLKSGDIVFARTGATTGKSYLIRECPLAIFASYLIRLRPSEVLLPEFIHIFFQTSTYWNLISENVSGNAQPNCNASKLGELPVPVPPQAEQSRIVSAVGRMLKEVSAARERLERVPTTLRRFREAVLAAACSGRLTADWRETNTEDASEGESLDESPIEGLVVPPSWKWLRSNDVFGYVTSGSRGWAKYYADTGAAFLRVGNLDHNSIKLDLRSIQRVKPPAGAEGARTRVRSGDILITITAEPGMIALVDGEIEEAYVNQHVALARPTGRLDSHFLAYFLAARTTGQSQFEAVHRGATKLGLGLDDIRSLWIASPPLAEQNVIVGRIEGLLSLSDTIEQRAMSALHRVEMLTQSILAKAFRGELVPTEAELARRDNRSYEPASELLARLKASVNGETKQPRARKSGKRATGSDGDMLIFIE